jgi:hypothetical protein
LLSLSTLAVVMMIDSWGAVGVTRAAGHDQVPGWLSIDAGTTFGRASADPERWCRAGS